MVDLTQEDYDLIMEGLKAYEFKCVQCKSERLRPSRTIGCIPFVDIISGKIRERTNGLPVITLVCDRCGSVMFIACRRVLPHYFD